MKAAQQQVEGYAFEEQFPVGLGLADLAAFHGIVVIRDEKSVGVGDPVFMVDEPADTPVLAGGIEDDRLVGCQKHEVCEVGLFRDKHPKVRC